MLDGLAGSMREGLAEQELTTVFASWNFLRSHHDSIFHTASHAHAYALQITELDHRIHRLTYTCYLYGHTPTMATPTQQPPIPPEERLALEQQARYQRITRNLAIGGVVLCPIIAILPPRKLDLYTFSLGVGFYLSADHLVTLRTGRGLVQNLSPMRAVELPTERARETQRILAEEREKGRKALEKQGEEKEKERGVLAKLWMGDEKEGWKERRLEEEKKALEEGKSYTDMIFEQIWDVWNWDKKKGGKGDDESKRE